MDGGRQITVTGIFATFMKAFDAQKSEDNAQGIKVVFDNEGEGGGSWTVKIKGNTIEVNEGVAEEGVSATLSMSSEDFIAIVAGELDGNTAFMTGKIRLEGEMQVVLKLMSVLDLKKAKPEEAPAVAADDNKDEIAVPDAAGGSEDQTASTDGPSEPVVAGVAEDRAVNADNGKNTGGGDEGPVAEAEQEPAPEPEPAPQGSPVEEKDAVAVEAASEAKAAEEDAAVVDGATVAGAATDMVEEKTGPDQTDQSDK